MDSDTKVQERALGNALDDIIGDNKSFDELYQPFWIITKANAHSRCKKKESKNRKKISGTV